MIVETNEVAINPALRSGIFGGRFIQDARKKPAWHGQGTTFEGKVTASEAVKLAGMDYAIDKVNLVIPTRWGDVETDKMAIVRQPVGDETQGKFLGYASQNFQLLQNTELAAMLDPITEQLPVECAFALNDGRMTVFTLDAGSTEIAGEAYSEWFHVVDGKDGGTSFTMYYAPVRGECQNTVNLGIRESTLHFRFTHRKGLQDKIEFMTSAMPQMRAAQIEVKAAIERLTKIEVDKSWMDELLRVTYPDPKLPQGAAQLADLGDAVQLLNAGVVGELQKSRERYEYAQSRVKAYREGAALLYERFNDEYPAVAGTGYAFVQAVAESADWRRGSKDAGIDALFGGRAQEKARAYQAVMGLN